MATEHARPLPCGHIGLVVHPRRESRSLVDGIARWADGHDARLVALQDDPADLRERFAPPSEGEGGGDGGGSADGNGRARVGGCDLVIALGGDGTILRALRLAAPAGVPVLGVNLGRLAFLAEVHLDDLPAALDALGRGEYRLEERSVLAVRSAGEQLDGLPAVAYNDVALTRLAGRGPAALAVRVDDELFARYTADAVVVATPTGSTAYSFAAGGPIVSPRHSGLLVTPVAPHSAFDRALFVHAEETVTVEVLDRSAPLLVEVDGQAGTELTAGDTLALHVDGGHSAHVIRLHHVNFYERARQKLQLVGSAELDGEEPGESG